MARIRHGDRIAREGAVLLACATVVFDADRAKILLTRRSDNGRWCLPGGHFEAGESVAEAAIRETKEETGLDVEVTRLIGVYSDPNRLLEYNDGNRFHLVALAFEARVLGGDLQTSDETTDFMWCDPNDMGGVDLMEHHVERIADALANDVGAAVR
jgi:ADP-ribose pyrophosphatase YjhB (NUDIX family)